MGQILHGSATMQRGNQDDSGAAIRMRELRRARDAGRAWPDRSYEPGVGAIHRGPRRLVLAAGWLCKWFFRQEESLACQADT